MPSPTRSSSISSGPPPGCSTSSQHRAGGAVATLLTALAVRDIGSCWVGSTIFAAPTVRRVLDLDPSWEPLGAVAIGHPLEPAGLRDPAPTAEWVVEL